MRGEERGERTHTWTLVVLRTPTLGVRGARKSEAAIRAATAKATVVKKPKAFWTRTSEEYMVGNRLRMLRPAWLLDEKKNWPASPCHGPETTRVRDG